MKNNQFECLPDAELALMTLEELESYFNFLLDNIDKFKMSYIEKVKSLLENRLRLEQKLGAKLQCKNQQVDRQFRYKI